MDAIRAYVLILNIPLHEWSTIMITISLLDTKNNA